VSTAMCRLRLGVFFAAWRPFSVVLTALAADDYRRRLGVPARLVPDLLAERVVDLLPRAVVGDAFATRW
jgi:hypothetical protein